MRVSGLTESKNTIQCQLMDNKVLVHKHLIVRAEGKNTPTDEEFLRRWLEQFIKDINMKVLMGPYVKYCDMPGNEGITGAAIIETSHIVLHTWNKVEPELIQFDVYSCSHLDPESICEKIKKDFNTTKIEYKFLDREHDLKELNSIKFLKSSN